ncbi:hypothetical protein M0R45_012234 [Rubus argutus]|uniref:Uncharacterized protein n=1 Tax=Rubus argutus TaxID=59490 RepID=A0AAW1YCI0_RUBAR
MRQGRSSKQETDQLMEIDDLSKLKEEPHHLSGAYIRSLVKQAHLFKNQRHHELQRSPGLNSPPFYSTSGSVSFSASASSPSSSSSPSLSIATDHELPGSSAAVSHIEMEAPAVADTTDSGITTSGGEGLHAAMDDEEMAEIRSIGEQHQMEWNDTMNLVTSAWWFKFLQAEDDDGYHLPFDEAMEFPAWLNANEGSFQQHLNDYYSADYFQDPALPCMDIGEFEGFDGEWLA